MAADDDVGIRLSVKDRIKFAREMKSAERSVTDLGDEVDKQSGRAQRSAGRWRKVGKAVAVGMAAATVAVGSMAVSGLNKAVEFETGMREVFTLLPGITGDAMSQMEEQVKSFATATGVLPNDSIPALYQALSAGVPQETVFSFLEQANKAAVAGVSSLETAVGALSSVTNTYGTDVLSAQQASDLMFTAVQGGVTDFDQLGANLSKVTPLAAGLGVEFGQVTAALVSMTKQQGGGTAEATTKLRALFGELSKAGGKTAKVFEDTAGTSFAKFIAKGNTIADAMEVMERAARKENVAIQDLFGSIEAGQGAMLLSGQGAEYLADALDANAQATGATEVAYDTMNASLGQSVKRIRAVGEMALLSFGQWLAPAAAEVAEWLEVHLPNAADNVRDAFQKVEDRVSSVTDWLDRNSTALGVVASVILVTLLPAMVAGTVQFGINTAAWVGNTAATVANTVARSAWTVVGWVVVGVTNALTVAGWGATAMSKVWTAAQWLLNAALTANPIGLVVAGIALLVAGFILAYNKSEGFRNAVNAMWDALKSGAESAVNFVIRGINTLIDGFNAAIRLANRLPHVNIPEIGKLGEVNFTRQRATGTPGGVQARAFGGLARTGTLLVGERGPELLHLGAAQAPAWVTEARQTRDAIGGDGAALGGDININIGHVVQRPGESTDAFAERLGNQIAQKIDDRRALKYGPRGEG